MQRRENASESARPQTFQYPLGGSWGCNLRVVSETQPRFCFSILWVDRGGATLETGIDGMRLRTFQYPLGGSWGCNEPAPADRDDPITFQYPLGGSWGCNLVGDAWAMPPFEFQYPLGGSWGCNERR